ncbi:MAG: phosphotransferase enzyme family protein [Ornithinibacter sp.]
MERVYAELDEAEQVEVLRRVALDAAEAFGFGVRDLTLVLHGFNTTFALDTDDGRRLALRVNTNSQSTPAHIAAQQSWLHALATETDVLVPDPVAAPGGGWHVAVECPIWGGPLNATVASWLDGDDVGRCDAEQAQVLGRTMAALHDHAEGFSLPPGAHLTVFDEPLCHDQSRLEGAVPLRHGHAEVVARSLALCRRRFDEVYAGRRPIVLHGDLHGGNLKWHAGRLGVFDLDDAGFGVPALDLAISTFYLRDGEPAVEEALRQGYAEVRALPDVSDEQFEALVAARQLLLANSLLLSSTASLREEATAYLDVTVERLSGWLHTGRFERSPAAG